ncbi:hypothetical protein [Corynebacterium pseudodiphtheriticum]|uniref:hypothetical protein n=1 Tax=Corynebacterium pseudodiphtheriticum TaxID=37637 RepID=UPI000FA731CD|nr:hypothetical protein [Corynebacterium pseudodiphtheriticum]MDK4305119.1 hypothetical protein [Corynebacterium pseudodiphtheriticum]RUQ01246.1 hypothetical protein D8M17_02740 [Corynebacterium pseudodiphtheriticum]
MYNDLESNNRGRRRRTKRISDAPNYDRTAERELKNGYGLGGAVYEPERNATAKPAEQAFASTGFDESFWREQRPPHSAY